LIDTGGVATAQVSFTPVTSRPVCACMGWRCGHWEIL